MLILCEQKRGFPLQMQHKCATGVKAKQVVHCAVVKNSFKNPATATEHEKTYAVVDSEILKVGAE